MCVGSAAPSAASASASAADAAAAAAPEANAAPLPQPVATPVVLSPTSPAAAVAESAEDAGEDDEESEDESEEESDPTSPEIVGVTVTPAADQASATRAAREHGFLDMAKQYDWIGLHHVLFWDPSLVNAHPMGGGRRFTKRHGPVNNRSWSTCSVPVRIQHSRKRKGRLRRT